MRRVSIPQFVVAVITSAVLATSPAATAQEPNTDGIAVIGYGEASAPAESATLHLIVGSDSYGGPPQPLQPGATPGARERASVEPVVQSLVDAGVAEDNIDVIVRPYVSDAYGFGGPAVALIRLAVDNPEPQHISTLVDAASVGAAEERLLVSRVTVSYDVADCESLRNDARQAAIEDGRQRAETQAGLLDVELGEVRASRDIPAQLAPVAGRYGAYPMSNRCGPFDTSRVPFGPLDLPPFDPTAEAIVIVTAQVELTFEMETSSAATPAS